MLTSTACLLKPTGFFPKRNYSQKSNIVLSSTSGSEREQSAIVVVWEVCTLFVLFIIFWRFMEDHSGTYTRCAFVCLNLDVNLCRVLLCAHHLPPPIKLTLSTFFNDIHWLQTLPVSFDWPVPLKTPTGSWLIRNSKQRESVNSEQSLVCLSVFLSLPCFCSKAAAHQ